MEYGLIALAILAAAFWATRLIQRALRPRLAAAPDSGLRRELEQLRADLAAAENVLEAALRPALPPAGAGITPVERAETLRRARYGQSAPVIAQALGAPLADIELLLELAAVPTTSRDAGVPPGAPRPPSP